MDVTFSDGSESFTIWVPGGIRSAPNAEKAKIDRRGRPSLSCSWGHQPMPCSFGDLAWRDGRNEVSPLLHVVGLGENGEAGGGSGGGGSTAEPTGGGGGEGGR